MGSERAKRWRAVFLLALGIAALLLVLATSKLGWVTQAG